MRVRLLTSITSDRRAYGYGEIVDLPDDEAKRYVAGNMAAMVTGPHPTGETPVPHREAAAKAPPQRAAKAPPRKR